MESQFLTCPYQSSYFEVERGNKMQLKMLRDKEIIFSLVCVVAIIVLLIMPTGFEKQIYTNAEHVKVKVIETNESGIYNSGLLKLGSQVCQVEVLEGTFKGQQIEAANLLAGRLEVDKLFIKGDKALALIEKTAEGNVLDANLLDYYRLNLEWLLVLLFMGALILFSGKTGVRTIISFVVSLLCMWKVLVPGLLKGYNPMIIGLVIGVTMAVVTLLLVAGFTEKAYCAIMGMSIASIITCVMAIGFGNLFRIHGGVMPSSESLLYSGYQHLDLTKIYQAAIYLSCSGALVDLAVDISAAIEEVVDKKPTITRKEILLSGLNIGRSVVGSQTTTLLLAYMGSFITIMMVYMAQGTPMVSILNGQSMASEILHTLVGCLGLVMVSPITAFICSLRYSKKLN